MAIISYKPIFQDQELPNVARRAKMFWANVAKIAHREIKEKPLREPLSYVQSSLSLNMLSEEYAVAVNGGQINTRLHVMHSKTLKGGKRQD